MTKTRIGDPFMSAHEFGRSMPKFSVNLLVQDIANSLNFYRDVLGAAVPYSDGDFAALSLHGIEFMLHAHHAYDRHPLYAVVRAAPERGVGEELRFLGTDPDAVEMRAKHAGTTVLQHGWREITLRDPDGYTWTVGKPIPPMR